MALKNGADLSLELPAVLPPPEARNISPEGAGALGCPGVVDAPCFGSELGKTGS